MNFRASFRTPYRLHEFLERRFPERRLFIRSDDHTRFIRLKPGTQILAWLGSGGLVAWGIIAAAILMMDSIGAGNVRAQAKRDQVVYEERLDAMSEERDDRAAEATAAQERFATALRQISSMQNELLASENRRRELETGIEVIQATLRRTMDQREAVQAELAALSSRVESGDLAATGGGSADSMNGTVDLLATALAETAQERDDIAEDAEYAMDHASDMELELRLLEEKNDRIFRQLEEAMTVSMEPLDDMFREAGMDPDHVINEVRKGYNGTGGPLTPLSFSTMGNSGADAQTERANAILNGMDEINLYRIAAQKVPFAMPVHDGYRLSSGFGRRWGRMHEGLDFAAPLGTPIYAPADGVVTYAGWMSGYGRLVKIQHEFGIETRYGHQSKIHVEVGQRVSRGERIGDIGSTGRSTGPHLHYEVRVGGKPVDPSTYIKAGKDVF